MLDQSSGNSWKIFSFYNSIYFKKSKFSIVLFCFKGSLLFFKFEKSKTLWSYWILTDEKSIFDDFSERFRAFPL